MEKADDGSTLFWSSGQTAAILPCTTDRHWHGTKAGWICHTRYPFAVNKARDAQGAPEPEGWSSPSGSGDRLCVVGAM